MHGVAVGVAVGVGVGVGVGLGVGLDVDDADGVGMLTALKSNVFRIF